jgi:hypothetical protein
MFGLQIVNKKKLEEIKASAKGDAFIELMNILRNKDKIFLDPVTLVGNNQTITNSVFFGNPVGLSIKHE